MTSSERENQTEERKFHRWYLRSQWALVIVTIIVGFLAWKNLKVIRKTYRETAKAVRAANTQASATIQSVEVARESMRVSNRPYVEIGRPDGKPIAEWIIDKSGKKTGLKISFQNAGNTPAKRFYVNAGDIGKFVHLTLGLGPPPKRTGQGFEIEPGQLVGGDSKHSLWTWLPGTTIPSHSTAVVQASTFTQDAIAKSLFKDSKGNIYAIFGDFEYMNVFGEYCCEPFILQWDQVSEQFAFEPTLHDITFCPPNIPNICRSEGEPVLPP